jgi:hypothetical protein
MEEGGGKKGGRKRGARGGGRGGAPALKRRRGGVAAEALAAAASAPPASTGSGAGTSGSGSRGGTQGKKATGGRGKQRKKENAHNRESQSTSSLPSTTQSAPALAQAPQCHSGEQQKQQGNRKQKELAKKSVPAASRSRVAQSPQATIVPEVSTFPISSAVAGSPTAEIRSTQSNLSASAPLQQRSTKPVLWSAPTASVPSEEHGDGASRRARHIEAANFVRDCLSDVPPSSLSAEAIASAMAGASSALMSAAVEAAQCRARSASATLHSSRPLPLPAGELRATERHESPARQISPVRDIEQEKKFIKSPTPCGKSPLRTAEGSFKQGNSSADAKDAQKKSVLGGIKNPLLEPATFGLKVSSKRSADSSVQAGVTTLNPWFLSGGPPNFAKHSNFLSAEDKGGMGAGELGAGGSLAELARQFEAERPHPHTSAISWGISQALQTSMTVMPASSSSPDPQGIQSIMKREREASKAMDQLLMKALLDAQVGRPLKKRKMQRQQQPSVE